LLRRGRRASSCTRRPRCSGVNFAEGLWAELHPRGVDVCCAVIGGTHTPARARLLGVEYDPESDMLAEDAASEIIEAIGKGPTHVVGDANRARR
jgi:short-subunit dehydrogenase